MHKIVFDPMSSTDVGEITLNKKYTISLEGVNEERRESLLADIERLLIQSGESKFYSRLSELGFARKTESKAAYWKFHGKFDILYIECNGCLSVEHKDLWNNVVLKENPTIEEVELLVNMAKEKEPLCYPN